MPYREVPPGYRTLLRALFSLAWGWVLVGGVAAYVVTPRTIEGEMGSVLMYTWATLAVLGGGAASYGAAAGERRYAVEWVASWFAAAGISAYALTVMTLVHQETVTRLTQAGICMALLTFVLARAVWLTGFAALRRSEHMAVRRVEGGDA